MSEAWLLELLAVTRDASRRAGYFRLAEHLDDAALLALSERHDRMATLAEAKDAQGLAV